MSGHSKWANIKHRKAAQDAKKGVAYQKLTKNVIAAAKAGGGDPNNNFRLKVAIERARAGNVPVDNIERAVKKGTGELGGAMYEEITYEGYGPGGVAVMVECLSNNRNRTVSEVRHAFTKCGGNLGTNGSVAYLFAKVGQIMLEPGIDSDHAIEVAIEHGAEEVDTADDGSVSIETSPENFLAVKTGLEQAGFKISFAEISMVASLEVELDGETSTKVVKLIDMLEDLDDVQEVYTNADLSQVV